METTLITGASSGIGEAFARTLARSGKNLLLVARSEDKLAGLCGELARTHGINAQHIALDLTGANASINLFNETRKRDLTVAMLVNNAGFGSIGDFMANDLERELNMIDLNVKVVVDLTYRFLAPMREAKRGSIINVASTASFQPVPYMSTYAATKAFVLSFSEALWEENRAYGIKVMALCPGVTRTNFFDAAGVSQPPMRVAQTSEQVVETALRGIKRGKSHIISGWANFFMIEAERLMPRSVIARLAGTAMRSTAKSSKN